MPKRCDHAKIKIFDYSALDSAFAKLSKPAQRALLNAKIRTPKDLAKRMETEVAQLHGIGPSAFPILRATLKKAGLKFK